MATKLMGAKVKSQQGENLGQVQDVIINPQSGRVEFAVLSSSTAGTGDKVIAVPWKLLSPSSSGASSSSSSTTSGSSSMSQPTFTASVDKDKLQRAPSFDKSHGPDMSSTDWSQKIYSYFGVEPETGTGGTGTGTGIGTGTSGSGLGTSPSGSGSSGSSTSPSGSGSSGSGSSGTSGSGTSGSGSGGTGSGSSSSGSSGTSGSGSSSGSGLK